jgi:thiosulfate dehydrogenase [quinone] large subunit
MLACIRILLGFIFLWAFADKLFGWHYATPAGQGWIDGGNPTKGFLAGAATGPFTGFYHAIAGQAWVNWLFMAALLGIGLALTLGIGMRLAAGAGAVLYLMMWSVALPPVTNPVIDDHILGALVVVLLALLGAGSTWGLANRWARVRLVRKYPALR